MDLKLGVPGECVEVPVAMQQLQVALYRNGCDQTVDEFADRFASTATCPVEHRRELVVRWFSRYHRCASQQTTQRYFLGIVARSRPHLHADHIADRRFAVERHLNRARCRAWCVPEEVNPSGGVDQDHRTRSVRMSSRSPSQPLPRSERASSKSSGTAASLRSARLTASRLVSSLNRAITAAHASSSISIFVRPIHQLYTTRCRLANQLSGNGRRLLRSGCGTWPVTTESQNSISSEGTTQLLPATRKLIKLEGRQNMDESFRATQAEDACQRLHANRHQAKIAGSNNEQHPTRRGPSHLGHLDTYLYNHSKDPRSPTFTCLGNSLYTVISKARTSAFWRQGHLAGYRRRSRGVGAMR